MSDGIDFFLADLVERARQAAQESELAADRSTASRDEAARSRRRSALLRRLVRGLQDDPGQLLLHCAWCGRIAIDEEFVAPEELLQGDLPQRLRERATHGICPDCLERERRASQAARSAAAHPPA